MAEEQAVAKQKTEVVAVQMTDGRTVNFAGKRKVNKETLIDESKIVVEGGVMQIEEGAVSVRMDFRSGETRTMPLPLSLFARFAGHGGEQKFGDELASPADKPLSEEDMVIAIDDLYAQIAKGEWGKGRASGGGGVSGAGIIVRALAEKTGKTVDFIKAFLQKKLDDSAARDGENKLTRRALYDSFRADPNVAPIIERMEKEKAKKAPAIDTSGALAEMES